MADFITLVSASIAVSDAGMVTRAREAGADAAMGNCYVARVVPGGAAAMAGIVQGDCVVEVGGVYVAFEPRAEIVRMLDTRPLQFTIARAIATPWNALVNNDDDDGEGSVVKSGALEDVVAEHDEKTGSSWFHRHGAPSRHIHKCVLTKRALCFFAPEAAHFESSHPVRPQPVRILRLSEVARTVEDEADSQVFKVIMHDDEVHSFRTSSDASEVFKWRHLIDCSRFHCFGRPFAPNSDARLAMVKSGLPPSTALADLCTFPPFRTHVPSGRSALRVVGNGRLDELDSFAGVDLSKASASLKTFLVHRWVCHAGALDHALDAVKWHSILLSASSLGTAQWPPLGHKANMHSLVELWLVNCGTISQLDLEASPGLCVLVIEACKNVSTINAVALPRLVELRLGVAIPMLPKAKESGRNSVFPSSSSEDALTGLLKFSLKHSPLLRSLVLSNFSGLTKVQAVGAAHHVFSSALDPDHLAGDAAGVPRSALGDFRLDVALFNPELPKEVEGEIQFSRRVDRDTAGSRLRHLQLVDCPNLISVNLSGMPELESLVLHGEFSRLDELSTRGCWTLSHVEVMPVEVSLPCLSCLDISGCPWVNANNVLLRIQAPMLVSLACLGCSWTPGTSEATYALSKVLEYVAVGRIENLEASGMLLSQVSAKRLGALRCLSLNDVDGDGSREFAPRLALMLPTWSSNLLRLSIAGSPVLLPRLTSLSGVMDSVSELNISRCNVVASDVAGILNKFPHLQHFLLRENPLLSFHAELSTLCVVDLSDCQQLADVRVSLLLSASTIALVKLSKCIFLESVAVDVNGSEGGWSLDLEGCTRFSLASLRRLVLGSNARRYLCGLSLSGCVKVFDNTAWNGSNNAWRLIACFPRLTRLELREWLITSDALAICTLEAVQVLNLRDTSLAGLSSKDFARALSALRKLTCLDVGHCDWFDDAALFTVLRGGGGGEECRSIAALLADSTKLDTVSLATIVDTLPPGALVDVRGCSDVDQTILRSWAPLPVRVLFEVNARD